MSSLPLTIYDIESASCLLEGVVFRTPLLRSDYLDSLCCAEVFLKPECLQHTGSFKFRGAYNAIGRLPSDRSERGIIASSSGNHAQGVAEACRILGLSASIIMPTDAPTIKRARTERSGATIIPYDRNDDRDSILHRESEKTGAYPIHPFDNVDVISGQGTSGLEVAHDLLSMGMFCDYVLVPTGGGGLISGVSVAIKNYFPSCCVHPVEPEHYDDYGRSLLSGERIRLSGDLPLSICDAIVSPEPGSLSFSIGVSNFGSGIVVSDDEALSAVSFAFREFKLVVEPGGAVALAALLSGKLDVSGSVVVIFLSGGNIDPSMMRRALEV